jgi:hypothetical protein
MPSLGGKQSFGEGNRRFRREVDISSFKRKFSRRPRQSRTALDAQIVLPSASLRPAIRPEQGQPIPMGTFCQFGRLRRCGRAHLDGRLRICLTVGGAIVASLSVVITADAQTICDLQQMFIDQLKEFDFTPVRGTSEPLSVANRYVVTAHDLSEKNDTPNFPNMLLAFGA